jgi:hypothetical protein
VTGGKLVLGADPDVKAAIIGGAGWKNYVAEATINVKSGTSNNAGIMFRTTGITGGPDGYHGYYFGIGKGGVTVGYADGGWHEIKVISHSFQAGTDYRLKAVVSDNKIGLYVNDVLVHKMKDNLFKSGTVGVRSYNEEFSADDISIRAIQPGDLSDLTDLDDVSSFKITGTTAYETIQIKYPKINGATSYKISYGTRPGEYTDFIYDVKFNPYKSSTFFSADKSAFTVTNNTTYYVKVTALNGEEELDSSEELTIKTLSYSKTAPQGLSGVNPTTFDNNDGKISGTSSSMEFRAASDLSYTPCNGPEITGLSAGTYYVRFTKTTDVSFSADTAVTISEAPLPEYTLIVSAGANGRISPSGDVKLKQGDTKEFTITPDSGYVIDSIKFNGTAVNASGTLYTTPAITADSTLVVTFKKAPIQTEDPVETPAPSDTPRPTQPSENPPGTGDAKDIASLIILFASLLTGGLLTIRSRIKA